MEKDKDLLRLDENTYMISEGEGRSRTHSYLIIGSRMACLIDTGMGYSNMRTVIDSLTDKKVIVICTHGHLDHIGGNGHFDEIHLHPADEILYRQHSDPQYRLAFLQNRAIQQGMPEEDAHSDQFRMENRQVWDLGETYPICDLTDNGVIDLGGRTLRVIHTPGHTMGSVCLLDEARGWLYTGDTVCEQGVLLNFPESAPVSLFLASLEKLWSIHGQYSQLWGGHQTVPLDKTYLLDYVACAKQALENENPEALVQYGRAAIALDVHRR